MDSRPVLLEVWFQLGSSWVRECRDHDVTQIEPVMPDFVLLTTSPMNVNGHSAQAETPWMQSHPEEKQ